VLEKRVDWVRGMSFGQISSRVLEVITRQMRTPRFPPRGLATRGHTARLISEDHRNRTPVASAQASSLWVNTP